MVVDECDSTMGCDADHDYQPPCPNNIVDASKAVWKALEVPLSQWGEMEIHWPKNHSLAGPKAGTESLCSAKRKKSEEMATMPVKRQSFLRAKTSSSSFNGFGFLGRQVKMMGNMFLIPFPSPTPLSPLVLFHHLLLLLSHLVAVEDKMTRWVH
ncbi:hypothetical protein SADUNF_Sadunf19G0101300 [Salix dunnii]|uniref:Uncharacterized protein n=1 Tax=Salix dunnii TaxID=1413687 RepID=A0A835J1G4_9ROSI|nr:hypothetical protein SADUNF_Sadunf19G0101300 [Salix dunnii]